jgi:hypothetical protein
VADGAPPIAVALAQPGLRLPLPWGVRPLDNWLRLVVIEWVFAVQQCAQSLLDPASVAGASPAVVSR